MIVSTAVADSRVLATSTTGAPKLVDVLGDNSVLTTTPVIHAQSTTEVMSSHEATCATSYVLLEQLTTINMLFSILVDSRVLAAVEAFIPTQDYAEYGYFYEDYVAY